MKFRKSFEYIYINKNHFFMKRFNFILITNYNKDRYLKKCLNYCLNQSYKNKGFILMTYQKINLMKF